MISHKTAEAIKNPYHLYDFATNNLPDVLSEALICDEAVDEDLFGRTKLIKEIISSLEKRNGHKKTVIGITGSWGSGKTTYLNIALKEIKKQNSKDIIVCSDFSAWKYSDERAFLIAIINEIYESLGIGTSDVTVYNSIIRYVNMFLSNNHFKLGSINLIADNNDKTIINVINEYLVQNNKHIIFVIDNIDRLNKNEMRFVYKAVGDIIDIKNITFVCLYDEQYVESIIKGGYPCNYLDKIVDIKIEISEPSSNKLYKITFDAIDNYFSKFVPSYSFKNLSYNDAELLKLAIACLKDVRSIILLLNKLFNAVSNGDFQLSYIDYFCISLIKQYDYELFVFILENSKVFVSSHKEYLTDYRLLDSEKIKKERKQIIADYFEDGKKYHRYYDFLSKLFPHSLDEYSSMSKEEDIIANTQRRICSGRFFEEYFKDSENNFSVAYDLIEKALKKSKSKNELVDSMDNMFDSYIFSDHKELLLIVEDFVASSLFNKTSVMAWLLEYLESHFYTFNDRYSGFSLSARSRAAIIIDKILISFDSACAEENIKRFIGDTESIVMLSALQYWNNASVKYNDGGESLINSISSTLESNVKAVIDKNINVFEPSLFRRGILWRIRDLTSEDELKNYLLFNVNETNIFFFLSELCSEGSSSNPDERFILRIDKATITSLIEFDFLLEKVKKASISSREDEILKKMIEQFENDNSKASAEVYFTDEPINIHEYYENLRKKV